MVVASGAWAVKRQKTERDTFDAQFYAREKKVLELTRLLHEEQTLNTYIAPKRMRNVFLP